MNYYARTKQSLPEEAQEEIRPRRISKEKDFKKVLIRLAKEAKNAAAFEENPAH